MGSITKRGDTYRAQVRRKGYPAECKTFPTKAQAVAWVRQREADIDRGAVIVQGHDLTVAELVKTYRKMREGTRPISDASNEHYQLKTLDRLLGDKRPTRMTPEDLVGFAAARRDEGAGPYTINMDISKLGTVLRFAAAALRVSLPDVVGSSRPLLKHLRMIGGGGKRERRPTDDELQRLLEYLRDKHGQVYADCVAFAAASAMRRGEVCALTWADISADRVATVARKHPRLGKVTERVPLVAEAWDIVQRQPKRDDDPRVFPLYEGTVSKYFTWACRALSIPDLHLHDLRHDGTSKLFEAGYSVPEVALVTGHKSMANLSRYTNLRPEEVAAKMARQAAAARTSSK